jgi:hypothetical protein
MNFIQKYKKYKNKYLGLKNQTGGNNNISEIDIKIIKQGIPSKNVMSCCFFTMPEAYRDFEKYQRNLINFLKYTNNLSKFEIRIYTDDSGKDFALEASSMYNSVSVYHFNSTEFRSGKGHIGTFGTLVRFLPLFESGLDIVWITDIDIPEYYLDKKYLEDLEKNECDISIHSIVCYNRKVYGHTNTILGGRFISKLKMPKTLLTNFIKKLINGSMNEIIDKLNKANKHKPESKFPYGIDEFFLNHQIYNLMQRKRVSTIVYKDYDITPGYYKYKMKMPKSKQNIITDYYRSPTVDKFKKVKDIFKEYVPNLLVEYPCFQELLDVLPELKTNFTRIFKL